MGKKKLIDDLSVQEMRHMREDGMTNREIAKSLDISLPTVLKYIGRQLLFPGRDFSLKRKTLQISPPSFLRQQTDLR